MHLRVHVPAEVDVPEGWGVHQRARVHEVVGRAIVRAAAQVDLQGVTVELVRLPPVARQLAARMQEAASERIDPARLRPGLDAYGIPSFDDSGTLTDVPATGRRPRGTSAHAGTSDPDPQPYDEAWHKGLKQQLRGGDVAARYDAFTEVDADFRYGDLARQISLFDLLLLAVQPDDSPPTDEALKLLAGFGRLHPQKLLELLRQFSAAPAQDLGGVTRIDTGFLLGTARHLSLAQRQEALDLAGAAVHVIERLRAARGLANEWKRGPFDVSRAIGLVRALVEERTALLNYLHDSPEATDGALLEKLRQTTDSLGRVAGLFAARAIDADLIHSTEADLVENINWVVHMQGQLRDIDSLLKAYRTFYGYSDAVDKLDEVIVLHSVREGYITSLAGTLVGTAAFVRETRDWGDKRLATWRTEAAGRKIKKLKQVLEEFQEKLRRIDKAYSSVDWAELTTVFDWKYQLVVEQIRQLGEDVRTLESPTSELDLLIKASGVEQSVPLISVRLSILSIWLGAILLQQQYYEHKIGSETGRAKWTLTLVDLRLDLRKSFDSPDFTSLPGQMGIWIEHLNNVKEEVQDAAFDELWNSLKIAVVTFIVGTVATAGVGTILEAAGAGWLVITLAEGLTFTISATAVGAAFGQTPTLSGFAKGLITNTLFIGTFKALGKLGAAVAEAIAPGRQLVRALSIIGAQAVGGTLASMTSGLIETGRLPEGVGNLFAAQILLAAVFGQIERAAPNLEDPILVRSGPADVDGPTWQRLVGELAGLARERRDWLKEMQDIIERGGPTPAEFEASKKRGVGFYRRLEAALAKMRSSEFSDAALARLGVTRDNLADFSAIAADYADAIAAARYESAIQAPDVLLGPSVVATSPGVFEYDPEAAGLRPDAMRARLLGAGYSNVIDEGGGVLKLAGPGGQPSYRLLPAGTNAPALALSRLIPPGARLAPRGLAVLRRQNAVPPLEAKLTSLATSDPDAVRLILEGIGRHIEAGNVQELQGIAHFLELGGKPQTLAVALGNGRDYGSSYVRTALQRFNTLTADGVKGVDTIITIRGTGPTATDAIVGIGRNFDPPDGVYGALGEIAPSTDSGLSEVLRYLAHPSEPNLNQAGLGALRAARTALREHPGARISFEEPVTQAGRVVRIIDFRLSLPQGEPLGYLLGEIKEVQDIQILNAGRSVRQFAWDVQNQAANPPPAPLRPLARLQWFIRWPNHPDGTLFTAAELPPVRAGLKNILRRAFDDPLLQSHPNRAALLLEFETHFDEIVRFF